MKLGMSLQELASKVVYNADHKKDVIVPANTLQVDVMQERVSFNHGDGLVTDHAFKQVTTDLGIPAAYVRKLREGGYYELLDDNVNTLLNDCTKTRMLRMIDGNLRGYLSNSFSTDYDNDVILQAVLPALSEFGDDIEIKSCSLTDTKMYLKVTSKKLMADVQKDDPVCGGITIVNSEVGMSFYSENEFIERLVCLNGMTRKDNISSFRKMHRGSAQPIGVIREDTTRAIHEAVALQIRDSIKNALNPARFLKTVEDLRETTERKIEGNPVEAIKELGKVVGYTQSEGNEILKHFIEGGDLSQYGLLNAVTRYAQDDEVDYDRASDLETIGGKILELSPKQWRNIKEAA